MKIVLDTNVVVSGLMTPAGVSAAVLARVRAGDLLVVLDARILAEYREVLARPRLAVPVDDAQAFVEYLERSAVAFENAPRAAFELPDPDDQPFLDVAIAAGAAAIATGNARHFPAGCGVTILSPRALLNALASGAGAH